MTGYRPHHRALLSSLFAVVICLTVCLGEDTSLQVRRVPEAVQHVECSHPLTPELLVLTLKETAGGLHVRTARKDNNQCSGNLTFSACFTDHTTVTIRAIIFAQGSGEFRSFECEATLLLESVTTVKHVGQLDINVTDAMTTTNNSVRLYANASADSTRKTLDTCVAPGAQQAAINILIALTVVFIGITALLAIILYKRDHLPSLSHVIGLPEGVTAARPHEREDNSNTPENTSIRHQTSLTSPPATPAPRAPGTEMDYKDKVALTAGDPLKPPTADTTDTLCHYQVPWAQVDKDMEEKPTICSLDD
ncbi:uncharacterized protein LOC112567721 isoform X2 [Pomacea canaliculata]|nr:uncharacterized protein LOC112567721 isoform X2 [Pomacea canaliculata]XP_025100286.1 uncharacterized protein LOC112567721 isoform X2 [Pomacea canaliculata]